MLHKKGGTGGKEGRRSVVNHISSGTCFNFRSLNLGSKSCEKSSSVYKGRGGKGYKSTQIIYILEVMGVSGNISKHRHALQKDGPQCKQLSF